MHLEKMAAVTRRNIQRRCRALKVYCTVGLTSKIQIVCNNAKGMILFTVKQCIGSALFTTDDILQVMVLFISRIKNITYSCISFQTLL